MTKLQSDRYKRGYFHEIWIKYYCLGENHASGTLSPKFNWCQNPCQLQNLKILLTFQGHKNLHGQNFYLKRQGYIDITRTKINLWSHHLHT